MTQASLSKRRGAGEDSIYWDPSRNRYIGAVSLGFNGSGTRIRKKVSGKTKTEVRDKLRELHKQVEVGLRPQRRYTVGDALEDWLTIGVDGLSGRTVSLYRGTIAKALCDELGAVRLIDLTAGDVQKALTAIASQTSTRTVQIAHNVLVRAIRLAERRQLREVQFFRSGERMHSQQDLRDLTRVRILVPVFGDRLPERDHVSAGEDRLINVHHADRGIVDGFQPSGNSYCPANMINVSAGARDPGYDRVCQPVDSVGSYP